MNESAMGLLTLDVECPVCRTRPNLRIMPALVELLNGTPADKILGTWGCQGKRCTEKVLITAGAVQRATPLTGSRKTG